MLEIKGIRFEVIITKKKIRNIYLRLKDTTVSVSAPLFMADYKIYQFIESRKAWIYQAYLSQQNRKLNGYRYQGGDLFYIFGRQYHLVREIGKSSVKIIDETIYLTYKDESEDGIHYLYKHLDRQLLAKAQIYYEKFHYVLLNYGYLLTPEIHARIMTSRWGVCYVKKNRINISSYLIHYPLDCLEYIMIHEMTHFIIPNHSRRFYQIVENAMPDYKIADKKLKQ